MGKQISFIAIYKNIQYWIFWYRNKRLRELLVSLGKLWSMLLWTKVFIKNEFIFKIMLAKFGQNSARNSITPKFQSSEFKSHPRSTLWHNLVTMCAVHSSSGTTAAALVSTQNDMCHPTWADGCFQCRAKLRQHVTFPHVKRAYNCALRCAKLINNFCIK